MPIEPDSHHALLEAAKKGNEAAFAEIVARYRNPITNYLYRMLNDYEQAVILAEETFVRVYFSFERYHTDFAFSTYIYRIATNLAVSEIRRRKRRKLLSLTGLFQTGEKSEIKVNLQNADFIENQQEKVVAQTIATLPGKYRAPLVLRDIEGKSSEEAAQILGLSLGTTKSRISRARGLLKEKLKIYLQVNGKND